MGTFFCRDVTRNELIFTEKYPRRLRHDVSLWHNFFCRRKVIGKLSNSNCEWKTFCYQNWNWLLHKNEIEPSAIGMCTATALFARVTKLLQHDDFIYYSFGCTLCESQTEAKCTLTSSCASGWTWCGANRCNSKNLFLMFSRLFILSITEFLLLLHHDTKDFSIHRF